ncbi:tail fiber protein [Klebsiella phage vB_KpM_Centimanus]
MDKSSLKITELPALSVASENGFIPIAQVKEENDTYKVTLKKLRESILFENAYSDTASGVANTVNGDTFFVYTDATKEHVQGWVNAGSGATPLLNSEGEQITYGTYALLNKALKDKGAIVQWVYNGGLSNGGEQTFTVPLTGDISVQEVYVDGLRQFKDVGFELVAGNALSFKLATPVKENQTVVAICFGSDDVEKVNEAFLATYGAPNGASNIGVLGGGTVQSELEKKINADKLSSASNGEGTDLILLGTGQTLREGLGEWLACTLDILTQKSEVERFKTRGFYVEDDGGAGSWKKTGNIDTAKAGTHVITEGKVYNANGVEYQIQLEDSSFVIDPRANGAKEVDDYTEAQLDTDDFVCLGQAINGIINTLPLWMQTNNNINGQSTYSVITFNITSGLWRIGKEAAKLRSNVIYNLGASTIYVKASASRKFQVTGEYLNGFEHSVEDVEQVYTALGNKLYWESVSLGFIKMTGGKIIGDHVPGTLDTDCTAGVGVLALNPWYCSFEDIRIENFRVNLVGMQVRIDEDGVMSSDIIPYKSSVLPEKIGNFYGCTFKNMYISTARYCCVRLHIDWCQWIGGTISNNGRWASSVSGQQCDYFLIETGHGFHCSGTYLSIPAYNPTERKPNKSVIATAARGSVYSACYMEDTPSYVTILNKWWNDGNEKGFGLNIDCIGSQYRPDRTYKYLTFEAGAFGYYDENENWVPPAGYGSYPSTNGIDFVRLGSPTPDVGAFPHGGFDFKYGTYGVMYATNTTYPNPPDVDSLRGQKTTKEMFSPYGLLAANGILQLPVLSPAIHSNICIWYKDLTGSFDLDNVVLWQTANIDQLTTDSGYNYNLFIAKAEMAIDFGNGYKMAIIQNLKWNNNDGVGTSGSQQSLQFTIPDSTPIVLKSVQAFTGGIPVFPTGLSYIPESSDRCIWGNVQPTNGFKYNLFKKVGGGIFAPGDLINPWIAHQRANPDYKFGTTFYEDYGYNNLPLLVKGGNTIGSYFAKNFSVNIVSVDNTNSRTTIEVPAEYKPYVFMGIPLNIVSGSSTSYTGETRIHKRIVNATGTLSGQYILDAVVGSVGDTLSISQTTLSSRTYYQDYKTGKLTVDGEISLNGTRIRFGYGATTVNTRTLEFFVNGGTSSTATINAYGTSIGYNAANNVFGGNITFSNTSTFNVGAVDKTANNIYSQNAVTVVSDRRLKDFIETIPDEVLDVWGTIGFSQWKLKSAIEAKGADEARVHFGIVAQDIKEAFELAGLDATKYGILIYDSWDDQEEILDEAGSVVQEAREAGDIWMVRMEECLALEAAYVRREMEKQRQQLQSLMDALGHS